jgi:hypothetical protein
MKIASVTAALLIFGFAFGVARADDSASQALLQAMAGDWTVTVGGPVPTELAGVPLPHGTLLGSVVSNARRVAGISMNDVTSLYYQTASAADLSAYEKTLTAGGWHRQDFGAMRPGFAASSIGGVELFCGATSTLTLVAHSANALQVAFTKHTTAPGAFDACSILRHAKSLLLLSPLPTLQAPAGMQMDIAMPTSPFRGSSAYITGTRSMATIFAAFTKQMIAGGWKAGPRLAGSGGIAQSFVLRRTTTTWHAVLTLISIRADLNLASLAATPESH